MRGLPTTGRKKRKLLILAIAAIFLSGLAWYVNHYISLDTLAEQLLDETARIRNELSANGSSTGTDGLLGAAAKIEELATHIRNTGQADE